MLGVCVRECVRARTEDEQALYLLFESSSGYGLFERVESEEIGAELDEVQKSIVEYSKFTQIMKLKAFLPFKSAEEALLNCNEISEGILGDTLRQFLEMNLPKKKADKKAKFALGVQDSKLGNSISEALGTPCKCNDLTGELLRGIRLHFFRMLKGLKDGDVEKAQLGLGHSYSRSKVKFNVNRVDNMIIQSICLLDQLDKDLNTMAMRCREWYSWHFPELIKIVSDNYAFCQLALKIGHRSNIKDEESSIELISKIVDNDESLARQVWEAGKHSMGFDINEYDIENITSFATRVVNLFKYRIHLQEYLSERMMTVAPNLATLVGEAVGARLISHAGSLTNLAKYPASTVQILGAEKALFRALKTKGNTPKYGLIFHSTFIGRAAAKNKGRISRYLANKCSIASRIDCFSETTTNVFGIKLREQVEERLSFYDTGKSPRRNIDVMTEAADEVDAGEKKSAKKKRKAKADDDDDEEVATPAKGKKGKKAATPVEEDEEEETPKKKKKKKTATPVEEEEEEEKPKKKKKNKS